MWNTTYMQCVEYMCGVCVWCMSEVLGLCLIWCAELGEWCMYSVYGVCVWYGVCVCGICAVWYECVVCVCVCPREA